MIIHPYEKETVAHSPLAPSWRNPKGAGGNGGSGGCGGGEAGGVSPPWRDPGVRPRRARDAQVRPDHRAPAARHDRTLGRAEVEPRREGRAARRHDRAVAQELHSQALPAVVVFVDARRRRGGGGHRSGAGEGGGSWMRGRRRSRVWVERRGVRVEQEEAEEERRGNGYRRIELFTDISCTRFLSFGCCCFAFGGWNETHEAMSNDTTEERHFSFWFHVCRNQNTVGFSQIRDIVALVHKNPSYVEYTRYSRNISLIYLKVQ